ncbi:hypothetical protein Fmac_018212 [Flemingia macrophylla]|uniref:Uncharacterized protein n=1 Tax=Flemingia macrophylla TaxID=520843 RepID=A0ABD1M4H4_9FABA
MVNTAAPSSLENGGDSMADNDAETGNEGEPTTGTSVGNADATHDGDSGRG